MLLRGSATLVCGDERRPLLTGTLVRVGPGVTRKLVTEDEDAIVLAIGATPGKAYGS